MKQYYCPYCSAQLNVNGFIALSISKKKSKSGMILLSEELGDYTSHISSNLTFEEGEKADFNCPSCTKSLEFESDKNLVRIFKTDKDGKEYAVIFSSIYGEQSTYRLSSERKLSFGEHAMKYADPEWYLKQ